MIQYLDEKITIFKILMRKISNCGSYDGEIPKFIFKIKLFWEAKIDTGLESQIRGVSNCF